MQFLVGKFLKYTDVQFFLHPKNHGLALLSGKFRLVKYDNLARYTEFAPDFLCINTSLPSSVDATGGAPLSLCGMVRRKLLVFGGPAGNLGGGFKYFFIFTPIWGRFPF